MKMRENACRLWLMALASCAAIVAADDPQCTNDGDGGVGTCDVVDDDDETFNSPNCDLWMAKSTIPGSGAGMFAGRDFAKDEYFTEEGDITIPIIDIELQNNNKFWHFLWDEYTWDAPALLMEHEGIDTVNVASPGFGSAANSVVDLANVEEYTPEHTYLGLHRHKDPGAGAFTPYGNRLSSAKVEVKAGNELFVNYGSNWFETREQHIGPIPIRGDYHRANNAVRKFYKRRSNYQGNKDLWNDLWETFAWNSPYKAVSRIFFALPQNWTKLDRIAQKGLIPAKREEMSRSLDELMEIGLCMDNFYIRKSTMDQAGHGAFAKRALKKGQRVAPLPLIHVPNRKRFVQRKIEATKKGTRKLGKQIVGEQILLNYCFAHPESTMLLCPYGLHTGYINHGIDGTSNVHVRWASPKRSNHNPSWLNRTLAKLNKESSAALAFELIASRDIAVGEEILLDYGKEWEEAWKDHVANWEPADDKYVSADDLNRDTTSILKTEFDILETGPYPPNVELRAYQMFKKTKGWQRAKEKGELEEWMMKEDGYYKPCEILRRNESSSGQVLYTAILRDFEEEKEAKEEERKYEPQRLENIPREAFRFFDRPYTSDIHLPNAFRHPMMIPDELFPDIWKNVNTTTTSESQDKRSN